MQRRVDAFPLVTFAVYVAVILFVVLHHEPWRDEADSWLYARDADALTIVERMRYAGTPALWYFLLFPFAKSGFPYLTESLLNFAIAASAVAIFLWRAPFSRPTKLLFIFSYYMGYEYSVIARSYSSSILLLFATAALYQQRFERPIRYAMPIALLFNTNAHSLLIAGTVVLAYAWDLHRQHRWTRRRLVGLGVMALGGLLAVLQLRPPPDGNIVGAFRMVEPLFLPASIGSAFIPIGDMGIALPLGFVVLATATVALRRQPVPLFVQWGSYAWLFYIFVFKYIGGLRHTGFILIVLIFALWISQTHGSLEPSREHADSSDEKLTRRALRLCLATLNGCLAVSFAITALLWVQEIRYPFSGAREMADYLKANRLTDHVIAAHKSTHAEAVLAYLEPTRFWYAGLEQFGSYSLWDAAYRRSEATSVEEAERRVREHFPDRSRMLLLLNAPLPLAEEKGYRLLYSTDPNVIGHSGEVFYLYRPLA